MRGIAISVIAVAACLAAAAQAPAQWGDAPLTDDRDARCPVVAGDGWFAALDARGRALVLFRTGPAGGAVAEARLALPARAFDCPAVSVAADGSALAGVAVGTPRAPRLIIARRTGSGPFAIAAERRLPRGDVVSSAAAARGGSGIVAWREHESLRRGSRHAARAVRFAAGVDVALPSEVLLAATRVQDDWVAPLITTGTDAAGAATVAWSVPLPPRRGGRISGLAAVDVAVAPAGASFGAPQRLSRDRQDVRDLALAVADDGRALLAHDGTGGVELFERAPGAGFALAGRYGVGSDSVPPSGSRPAVALAAGGAAVLAWREVDGISAVRRTGPGAFTPPQSVAALAEHPLGLSESIVTGASWLQRDEGALGAAVRPGGAAALAWLATPALPGTPFTAAVATSSDGPFGPATVIGGVVRDVRAVAPLLDVAGPGVLWSDDRAPQSYGTPRAGRLHLGRPDRPLADPPPPGAVVTGHSRRLFPGQVLRLTLGCAAACEIRARVPGRRRSDQPAVALGGRDDAGAVTMRLQPWRPGSLARRSGRIPVVLDVAAPGGTRAAHSTVRLAVTRRRLPRFRRPLDVAEGHRRPTGVRSGPHPLPRPALGRSRHGPARPGDRRAGDARGAPHRADRLIAGAAAISGGRA